MGLAANQARLLVLTARNSDLQFRAQCISNHKLLLAMQTSSIAQKYSEALSNRRMSFVYDMDQNTGKSLTEDFSITSVYANNSAFIGSYRIVLPDGRIAVPSIAYLPKVVTNKINSVAKDSENASGLKAGSYPLSDESLSQSESLTDTQKLNYISSYRTTLFPKIKADSANATDKAILQYFGQPVDENGAVLTSGFTSRKDKFQALIDKGVSGLTEDDKKLLKSIFATTGDTGYKSVVNSAQTVKDADGKDVNAQNVVKDIMQKTTFEDTDWQQLLDLLKAFVQKEEPSATDLNYMNSKISSTGTDNVAYKTLGDMIDDQLKTAKSSTATSAEKTAAQNYLLDLVQNSSSQGYRIMIESQVPQVPPEAVLTVTESGGVSCKDEYNNEYVVLPALFNVSYFQNALRTGSIEMQKYTTEGWSNYNYATSSIIRDELYTEDDAAAEAEYETQAALLQAQDKMLDVEMRNIETEMKACEAEMESVKKMLEKNIESFKTSG